LEFKDSRGLGAGGPFYTDKSKLIRFYRHPEDGSSALVYPPSGAIMMVTELACLYWLVEDPDELVVELLWEDEMITAQWFWKIRKPSDFFDIKYSPSKD